jgi:hypothetical protein
MDDRVWDLIDDALADATDIRSLDGALASYGLRAVRVFDTPDDAFMELHDLETKASVAALVLFLGSGIRASPSIRVYGPAIERPFGR